MVKTKTKTTSSHILTYHRKSNEYHKTILPTQMLKMLEIIFLRNYINSDSVRLSINATKMNYSKVLTKHLLQGYL